MDEDFIIVPLPDGRRARFPRGTDPKVIEATVQRESAGEAPQGSASGAASLQALPPSLPAGSAATSAPSRGGLADSFLARAGRGAMINRFDPVAEMVARGAAAVAPDDMGAAMMRGVQQAANERRESQARSRTVAGSTGMDGAATAGTAAADALLFKGLASRLGMRTLTNPQSLLDVTKGGALAGGLGGALSPTEGSENMSGFELALQKAKQSAIGVGVGAVAAPVFSLALGKAGQLANAAIEGGGRVLRNMTGRNTASNTVSTPAQLEKYLSEQAAAAGVDWARVPGSIKASLQEATRRATATTGALPTEAVRNRLVAEAENLPQLTLGQATRDPAQFSRETNSPDEILRNLFGDQRNAATARLTKMADEFGPPQTQYELGSGLSKEVSGQAAATRKAVGDLYDAFRDDAAGYHKLTNTPGFVKNALAALKTNQQFDDLPKTFRDQLMGLARKNGNLSIRDASQMWKNINSHYESTYGTPAGSALSTLKTEAGKLLDDATFAGTKRGEETIAKFRDANKARKAMSDWEDSSAAIADMAAKNPRVATEAIFSRYVMSGSVDDFTGLWKTLPGEARQNVKRAFVERMANQAMNDYGTSATRSGGAVRLLSAFPKEKMTQMFGADELKSLRNTLEYLRLTSEAPAGNFVNRSNSLVDLKDFLGQTKNVPILGPGVSAPLRRMIAEHEARTAASGTGLVAPPGPTMVPRPIQSLVRRTPTLAPQTGPVLQGAFSPSGVAEDDLGN